MDSVRKLVFPMTLICAVLLIVVTGLIAVPTKVLAAAELPAAIVSIPTPLPVSGEAAVPTAAPTCLLSPAYPAQILQWCDLIWTHATAEGLDPNLVAALIWLESGGDANALSRSGAIGLMQVMPRDGRAADFQCKNGPCFANRPSMAELYDPAFNIQYGTHFLAGLLAKRGSLREALYAYGPMDVGYSYADRVLAIYEQYR